MYSPSFYPLYWKALQDDGPGGDPPNNNPGPSEVADPLAERAAGFSARINQLAAYFASFTTYEWAVWTANGPGGGDYTVASWYSWFQGEGHWSPFQWAIWWLQHRG